MPLARPRWLIWPTTHHWKHLSRPKWPIEDTSTTAQLFATYTHRKPWAQGASPKHRNNTGSNKHAWTKTHTKLATSQANATKIEAHGSSTKRQKHWGHLHGMPLCILETFGHTLSAWPENVQTIYHKGGTILQTLPTIDWRMPCFHGWSPWAQKEG